MLQKRQLAILPTVILSIKIIKPVQPVFFCRASGFRHCVSRFPDFHILAQLFFLRWAGYSKYILKYPENYSEEIKIIVS